ncbi:hypothetical protein ACW0TR_10120 [Fusobacterium polymorphum]|uniref:Uncharacterized protein n=1 Tax=Fusobacterium nucleatum subsp. polymorphum TaxID=76857 RepID=A0A246EFE2_FUSNP|nr:MULTISPECIES: hypothetical protein [Fusobacterium]OWP25342.1 hypothetical protein CA839_05055 [Fusobacterium polymorphum]WCB33722.1 hypothetical protein PGW91_00740 [Fusobacterium nucleatum]
MKKRFLLLNFLLFIIYSFNLLAINFPEKANKEEKVVESIDIEHRYILDAMTEATASEILDKYVYKSN